MITHSLHRSTVLLTLALAGATLLPAQLRAQQAERADPGTAGAAVATAVTPAPVGPRVAAPDFVRFAPANPFDAPPPQEDRIRSGPNIAMMAVGGAALVVGLVIGGDGGLIIATTGGVVALVGLYRYLR